MDCEKQNKELQQMCAQRLAYERDLVERFKLYALKNGCSGIKSIGRKFRIMDDSGDRSLSLDEFIVGCRECRISKMSPDELKELFVVFDKNGNGKLDIDEFLSAVRPRMANVRKLLVTKAFAKMDKTGDGVITLEDLVSVYDVSKHPKYQNGEKTKKDVLLEFLRNFEADESVDGKVTKEEWMDYYAGVSASIDDDAYFSLMMYNSWKVKPTE